MSAIRENAVGVSITFEVQMAANAMRQYQFKKEFAKVTAAYEAPGCARATSGA